MFSCAFSGVSTFQSNYGQGIWGFKFCTLAKFMIALCTKLQSVRVALTYNVNLSMDEIIDADSSTYYEAKVALELLIVTLS